MFLEPSRFSCSRTSTENDELEVVFSGKDYGGYKLSTIQEVSGLSGHLLASVLLVKIGETCAVGSNVRMNGRGSSPRKNSSGVMNLMPTLLARSLQRCQDIIKCAGKNKVVPVRAGEVCLDAF